MVAGWLWMQQGPGAAFLWGSFCAILATGVLLSVPPQKAAAS
jgi:hypothetical protein